MKKIQMVDLHSQYLRIKSEMDEAMQSVIDSSAFINGYQVGEFANRLASYLGIDNVVTCANGTDALQIALMSLGLERGDEVIVPVHTYVATAEVIALLGLKPVFVDCYPDVFTIDVSKIASVISSRTKAIVPVHLYGQCADMEPLLEIARIHSLFVIEDVAQAIGAEYKFSDGTVMKAGTIGDIGTTSFFPSKNLGCFGDGGALFINRHELFNRARMIANHGQRVKYHHDIVGCNSRLDTIQAAVLNVKLKYLNDFTKARNNAAVFYDRELANVFGIKIPHRATYSSHVFHQYTIRVIGGMRDVLKEELAKNGVPTMIYYPIPLHLQKAFFQEEFPRGSFPISEGLSEEVLSLPMHTELSDMELRHIVGVIKEIMSYERD